MTEACVGLVAGAVVMVAAYSWARTHATGYRQFDLFWIAECLFMVPAFVRLLGPATSRAERLTLLVLMGLFDYLPKFLRDPTAPVFHDELVHWHQAQVIFATGKAFEPTPLIPVIQYFPGLHVLTAEVQHMTGLSTFQVGSVLLAVLHALSLIGVSLIGERLFRSSYLAGICALVYSLNPGFVFFDSQFAYDSLAVPLAVWSIVCVVEMQSHREPALRRAWFALGTVVALGCTVTHHLTTYALVVSLVITALGSEWAPGLLRVRNAA